MITSIIVDDELIAIKGLHFELLNFSDRIAVLEKFTSAEAAILFLQQEKVDVVFLDVEMPGMNGFEFLQQFPQRNFQVVFSTAYSSYALNAIQEEAVYYLLKPVDAEELEKCLERIDKVLQKDQFEEKLDLALAKLNELGLNPKKIRLSFDGKIAFYEPSEIDYFEAKGNYTSVHLNNGNKILLTRQLKQIENELPDYLFCRIHKSYLVNLTKVRSFTRQDSSIILDNDIRLPVSSNKRENIVNRLL